MIKNILYLLAMTMVLFSCKKSTPGVTCMEDLKDAKVGVITGTPEEMFADNLYKKENIFRFDYDMLPALVQGKIDAALDESISIHDYSNEYPEIKYFEFTDGEATDIAFAVSTDQRTLCNQLSHYIDSMKTVGAIDSLMARWETKEGANGLLDCYRSKAKGAPIKVASSCDLAPYNYIVNNEPSGFEIELLEMFAESIGRTIKTTVMDLSSVPTNVTQKRSDIGAGMLSVTDEHAQKVLFSSPYKVATPVVFYFDKEFYAKQDEKGLIDTDFLEQIEKSFYDNLICEDRYMLIINGMLLTAEISLIAIFLGTLLGGGLCYMRMNRRKWMRHVADIYIRVIRGTPMLVLLLLMYYVVFNDSDLSSVVVASISFAVNMAAYVCEILRTGIESIDRGQTEAGLALGFSRTRTFLLIVMPQALKRAMPVYINECVSVVLETSIVGYIAVMDMTKASDVIRARTYDAFFPLIITAILYFIITWLIIWLISLIAKYVTIPSFGISGSAGNSRRQDKPAGDTNHDNSIITVSHLAKTYDNGLRVIKDVTTEIKRGEVISIIGPSGTGKSTFLRCLTQLVTPTSGSICVGGIDALNPGTDICALRMKMGMVFQSFNLFDHLTVLENITLAPMKLLGKTADEAKEKGMELLQLVGLSEKHGMYPNQLSGGQKQRIAIARALAMEPEILLFDEPTSALDPTMVSEVLNVMRALADRGITMLIVTHEMRFAHDVSTRVLYMDEGSIYEDGTAQQIFENPQREKTRIFINRIRTAEYRITSRSYDYYDIISNFENFCSNHSLSRKTKDNVQHCVDETLAMLMPDGEDAGLIDITMRLSYSETNGNLILAVTSANGISENMLNDENNAIAAAIIRNGCDDVTIDGSTIEMHIAK